MVRPPGMTNAIWRSKRLFRVCVLAAFALVSCKEKAEKAPPRRLTTKERHALARKWNERLKAEGLGDMGEWLAAGGRRSEVSKTQTDDVMAAQARANKGKKLWFSAPTAAQVAVNPGVFQEMADFYWLARADLELFELWALEGLDLSDIATRTGVPRSIVHRTIQRLREEMPARLEKERRHAAPRRRPGRGGPDQETGHADEEEVEDRGGAG